MTSNYYPESEKILIKDIIGKEILFKKVVFDNKGKGDFGIFLVEESESLKSFTTSAKAIMGWVYKVFANYGIRITSEEIYDFPDEWKIKIVQKESREGNLYLDYENV
jgi:hypothetical protein